MSIKTLQSEDRTGSRLLYQVIAATGLILLVLGAAFVLPASGGVSTEKAPRIPRPLKAAPHPPYAARSLPIVQIAYSETDTTWFDPILNRDLSVRRALRMTASPRVQERRDDVMGRVLLDFSETAMVRDDGRKGWQVMPEEQLERWVASRAGPTPLHASATASIRKSIASNGDLHLINQVAFGYTKGGRRGNWDHSQGGVSIRLDWKNDRLLIWWGSPLAGVGEHHSIISPPFPDRVKARPEETGGP